MFSANVCTCSNGGLPGGGASALVALSRFEESAKVNRSGAILSLLAACAVVLSGCGSTTHASSSAPSATPSPVQCGGKNQLKASGATAQENAIEQFVYSYVHACAGYTLDYNANGSGAGVTDFVNNVTDLAGSGDALNPSKGQTEQAAQRCGSPAWNLPTVFEPIAITYHLNGVSSLNLDGPTLARIFNGGITRWDDPAIKALNPGANLPSAPIHVFFRSDQSANTSNFEQYLDTAADGAWAKGVSQTFGGGVGDGAAGDNGTSAAVQSTDGSITYNEWSFGVGKQLNMAQIITSAGPEPVSITTDSVAKTIAGATIQGAGQRPDRGHLVVLQADAARRVPDRGGDLRDRLLEVSGCRDRRGGKGILCKPQSVRAKLVWTSTVPFRCRVRSNPEWRRP